MNALREPTAFLARHLRVARVLAARIEARRPLLAPLFPLEVGDMANLSDNDIDQLDAMKARFEQLQTTLADGVFRGIAIVEMHDADSLSKRDIADLMEKFGVLESSDVWTELSLLRNRLAHAYPEDSGTQVARLNAVFDGMPVLLAVEKAARNFVVTRGRVDVADL